MAVSLHNEDGNASPHERLGHTLVISATAGARAAAAPDAELTHAGAPDGIRKNENERVGHACSVGRRDERLRTCGGYSVE